MQEQTVPMSKMELQQHIFDTIEPGYVLRRDVRSVTEHLTDFVWSFIEDGKAPATTPKPCKADDILDIVCEYHGLTLKQLTAKGRKRHIVIARMEAMIMMRKRTVLSFKAISDLLGFRNHTTVIHACNTIKDLMETDEKISTEVAYLYSKLRDTVTGSDNLIPFSLNGEKSSITNVRYVSV